jgi:hypothetical protein
VHNVTKASGAKKLGFMGIYGASVTDVPGIGNPSAWNANAAEPCRPDGVWETRSRRYGHGYCSGGFFSEPGFTDRIQVMTFQRSSEVLNIPPKGGIGPTTTSCLTRL